MEKDSFNAIIIEDAEPKVMKSMVNKFTKSMEQYLYHIKNVYPAIHKDNRTSSDVIYSAPLSSKGLITYKITLNPVIFQNRIKVLCNVKWYATLHKGENGCIENIEMHLYACSIRLYDGPNFYKTEQVIRALFGKTSSYVKGHINDDTFNTSYAEDYVKSCKRNNKNSHN